MSDPDDPLLVRRLVELLDVERLDRDLFRGARKIGGVGRVFGGQAIAQALVSAMRSVEDEKVVHSLHAYFMRGGSEELPILFRVTRDFDGRSFATRRVVAQQDGVPILVLAASFQRPDAGYAHAGPMPDVAPPETLPTHEEAVEAMASEVSAETAAFRRRPSPIEIRQATPDPLSAAGGIPVQYVWFRTRAPIADDPQLHRAVLAYMSDLMLLGTSLRVHLPLRDLARARIASLDHAMWLHDTPRTDDWLLFACDSPWAGQARGFNRGSFWTRDGRLIASVAQEGMMRPPRA